MKKINFKLLIIFISIATLASSCVPFRQFEEEKKRRETCENDLKNIKNQNQDLSVKVTELTSQNTELKNRLIALEKDTSILGSSLRVMSKQYDKINTLNQELIAQLEKLQAGNVAETKKISGQLQLTQEELLKN